MRLIRDRQDGSLQLILLAHRVDPSQFVGCFELGKDRRIA
jgi:hypothetical protein